MITQGDVKMFLSENGVTVYFIDGQPVMEQGLENQALISLLTSPGWAGNALLKAPIGSDFEQVCAGPITKSSLEDSRKAALAAMKSEAFGKILAEVSNPSAFIRDFKILVQPPGQTLQEIKLSQSEKNWALQANKPPVYGPGGSGSVTEYSPPLLEFWDNFNDANGTPITSHLSDSGHSWINLSGAGQIQGNRLASPTSQNAIVLVSTDFSADGVLSGVLHTADANQYFGLIFKAKDLANMLTWFYLSGAWKLVRYTGGSPVQLAADFMSDGFSAGDNDIKIVISGDNYTMIIREGQVDELVLGPYSGAVTWPETKIGAAVSTGSFLPSRHRHLEYLQFAPA